MPRSRTLDYGKEALRLCDGGLSAATSLLLIEVIVDPRLARTDKITALIELAYRAPDGGPIKAELLSIPDRTAAVFDLAFHFGHWPAAFVSICHACSQANHVRVSVDEYLFLPAKAGTVTVDGRCFTQPNADDERRLARGDMLSAASLCVDDLPRQDFSPEQVFSALDVAAARFDPSLPFACSACGAANRFWFDPLDWIETHLRQLVREVHLIARHYGWRESDILSMSHSRRRLYLGHIGDVA